MLAPVTKAGGKEGAVEGDALKLVALLGVLPTEALLCASPRLPTLVFELDASARLDGPPVCSSRDAFNCRFSSSRRLHRSDGANQAGRQNTGARWLPPPTTHLRDHSDTCACVLEKLAESAETE